MDLSSTGSAPGLEGPRGTQAIQSENERLRKALDERIEFIEDMSHELRSGLTFVRGYVDLFLSRTLGPISDPQENALHVIERRTEAITELLDQMLSLERARAGHLEPQENVDVSELVRDRVLEAGLAAERASLTVVADLPSEEIRITADPVRLGQALDNLITNAIKFSSPGGEVRVSLEHGEGWIRLTVRDMGIGMDQEELDHLFERFYRTSSGRAKSSGTGLGLVITKAIVEAHGGEISVNSAQGAGSSFIITLPCTPRVG